LAHDTWHLAFGTWHLAPGIWYLALAPGTWYLALALKRRALVLEEIREQLIDLIKTMPADKLQILIEFINHLNNDYQDGEDSDDELLMT
jgi:hypothetical protein